MSKVQNIKSNSQNKKQPTESEKQMFGFIVSKKLGEGSYSSVHKAFRISDKTDYAMKKIKLNNLTQKERENAVNEVRFLASISNQHVVSYKDSIFDDSTNYLYIIMELMPGGDVLSKLRQLKEKKAYLEENTIWRWLIQITKGIKALHDLKILHRDLKCANVFLSKDQKEAKLGDLNVSKVAKQGLLYTQTGTPYYASPEVWKDKPYNSKSDIWSLGCVLYEMCALHPPFMGQNMEALFKKIQKGQFVPIPSQYSNNLAKIISACLSVIPGQRPSCERILQSTAVVSKIEQLNMGNSRNSESTDVTGTHSSGGFNKDGENDQKSKINKIPFQPQQQLSKQGELLQTIRIGKNLKNLSCKLPQQQYTSNSCSPLKRNKISENGNQQITSQRVMEAMGLPNQLAVVKQNNSNILKQQQQQQLIRNNNSIALIQRQQDQNGNKHHVKSTQNLPTTDRVNVRPSIDLPISKRGGEEMYSPMIQSHEQGVNNNNQEYYLKKNSDIHIKNSQQNQQYPQMVQKKKKNINRSPKSCHILPPLNQLSNNSKLIDGSSNQSPYESLRNKSNNNLDSDGQQSQYLQRQLHLQKINKDSQQIMDDISPLKKQQNEKKKYKMLSSNDIDQFENKQKNYPNSVKVGKQKILQQQQQERDYSIFNNQSEIAYNQQQIFDGVNKNNNNNDYQQQQVKPELQQYIDQINNNPYQIKNLISQQQVQKKRHSSNIQHIQNNNNKSNINMSNSNNYQQQLQNVYNVNNQKPNINLDAPYLGKLPKISPNTSANQTNNNNGKIIRNSNRQNSMGQLINKQQPIKIFKSNHVLN